MLPSSKVLSEFMGLCLPSYLHLNRIAMNCFQVNTKYLAPLLVAYDDRLKEKEAIIETYEVSVR